MIQRIQPGGIDDIVLRLRTLVIITNAEGTLLAESVGPEALDGGGAKVALEESWVWR